MASKKSAHSLKQNTTDLCPPAHLSKLAHYNARPDIKARSITLLPSPHRLLLCTRILKIPDTQFMGFLCFSSKTPQNLSMCRFPSSFPSISELRRDKYFVSSSTRSSDYQNRFCTKSWIVKYEKRRSMCLLSPAAVSALKKDSWVVHALRRQSARPASKQACRPPNGMRLSTILKVVMNIHKY